MAYTGVPVVAGNPWAKSPGVQSLGAGAPQISYARPTADSRASTPLAAASLGDHSHTVTLPHALFGQSNPDKYQAIYASTTAHVGTVAHYIAAHITERVGLYRDRLITPGINQTSLSEQSLWAMAAADLGAIFRGQAFGNPADPNAPLRTLGDNSILTLPNSFRGYGALPGFAEGLPVDSATYRFVSFLQLWQSIPEALRTEEMQRVVLQFSCGTLRVESWLTMQRQDEFAGSRLLPWVEQDALGLVGAMPEGDVPSISVPVVEAGSGSSVPPARSTTIYDEYQEQVYRLMEQVRSHFFEKLRGCDAYTSTQAAYLARGIILLSHKVRRLAAVRSEETADLIASCDTLVARLPDVTAAEVEHVKRPFPTGISLYDFLRPAPAPAPEDVVVDIGSAASVAAPGTVVSRVFTSRLEPHQVPTMLVDRLAVATTSIAVNQALLQSHMMHDPVQLPVIQPFLSSQDSIDAQLKEAFRDFALPSKGVRSVFLQDLYEVNSHVPFGLIEVTVRLVSHLKSKLNQGQFAALYEGLGRHPHDRWAEFVDLLKTAAPLAHIVVDYQCCSNELNAEMR